MDIPSLFMIPSAVSSGKVHSVFPNSTDADFDFNRDSDATRVNSEGLIERVGYYGNDFVVNGGFDTNSNWGLPTGWSIENGKLNAVNVSAISATQNTSLSFVNKSYKVIYTISDYESGDLRIFVGGTQPTPNRNANGTYTEYVEIESANSIIYIQGINNFTGSIDNISIQEITGDRARLNYEIEGGLVNTKPSLLLEPQSTNLITYSEDFSQWSLGANGFLTYEKDIVAPDGTLGVYRLKLPATGTTYLLSNTFSSSNPLSVSVFAKATGTGNDNFNLYTGGSNVSPLKTATDEWQKFEYTASGNSFYIINSGDSFVSDIYIWGAQAEALSYCTSLHTNKRKHTNKSSRNL
jgi:hypothetical protein